MLRWSVFMVLLFFCSSAPLFADHPLITDDTATQGRGRFQLEMIGVNGIEDLATILSYGMSDNLDLIVGNPYQLRGISDAALEVKWRFHQNDSSSFAVKGRAIFPTAPPSAAPPAVAPPSVAPPAAGSSRSSRSLRSSTYGRSGLPSGGERYAFFFIATEEFMPWACHLNLGCRWDEKMHGTWHASLASEVEVRKNLTLVANLVMERGFDGSPPPNPPLTILGGVVYSLSKNVDLGLAIKAGLGRPETRPSILPGLLVRW